LMTQDMGRLHGNSQRTKKTNEKNFVVKDCGRFIDRNWRFFHALNFGRQSRATDLHTRRGPVFVF
jgi:hypothetical protein